MVVCKVPWDLQIDSTSNKIFSVGVEKVKTVKNNEDVSEVSRSVYVTFPQSFLLHAKPHRHRAPVSLKKFNATEP